MVSFSPDIPVRTVSQNPKWFHYHQSRVTGEFNWITASGIEGIHEIRIRPFIQPGNVDQPVILNKQGIPAGSGTLVSGVNCDTIDGLVFSGIGGNTLNAELGIDDGEETGGSEECFSDVCLNIDNSNLNYTSSLDIYGFQFSHDDCATGAGGGDAAAAGFMVSASSGVVLGFSMTGTSPERNSYLWKFSNFSHSSLSCTDVARVPLKLFTL